ncbi:hypothetical protein SapgrDRAFT_2568 [Saprospira grandis DSM 2844]|uniref:Uncharacterized protein n=1 Tax=Saprospira grandis DSM 2844 TaxID=694433 RepID=J0XYK6_9BACT|nr:hypothetical protein [Saprospira grandis]EJF54226.1 hypothetical protein SapgrDRAFT_2568 [Saprospira grandis DSM 2844]
MRLLSLLIFGLFLGQTVLAQLDIENCQFLPDLKSCTTLVFMPAYDTAQHHSYRQLIEREWQLTPIKFVSYREYLQYKNKKGYAYLLFGDDKIKNASQRSSYVYLELWLWANAQKKRMARMELYPDAQTSQDPSLIYDYRFHTEGHIFNWSEGLLKNYLQQIQDHLQRGQKRSGFRPGPAKAELKALKTDTLFVPDYVLKEFNTYWEAKGTQSAQELMAKYPYPYKILSNKELSKRILNCPEGKKIYYLLFVRSNSDKYVSVVEGKSGDILYSRLRPLQFNLRPKDLQRLAKKVSKF